MPRWIPSNQLSHSEIQQAVESDYHIDSSTYPPRIAFPDNYRTEGEMRGEQRLEDSARESVSARINEWGISRAETAQVRPRPTVRAESSRFIDSFDAFMATQHTTVASSPVEDSDEDDNDSDMMFDDEDLSMYEPPRRTSANDFPEHSVPSWASDTSREHVVNLYMNQIEYRLRWIFYREEREGFRRRGHGVRPFSRQDFLDRLRKQPSPHPLNTDTSTFYDWNIGATDFILRLENFFVDGSDCLRIHFIHKPTMQEIGFQDRIWNGEHYNELHMEWAHG